MPTIGSWYKTLLKKAEENTDENYTFHYSYLKKVMKQYVRELNGQMAYFDGQSTFDLLEGVPFINLDISQLEERFARPLAQQILLSWIWEKFVKKNSEDRNKATKKRVLVDEAWMLLPFPEAVDFLNKMARRARKRNVSLAIVSQRFQDFYEKPEAQAVLTSSDTKLFLAQDKSEIEYLKSVFKLSEGESNFLITCLKGEGLLIKLADNNTGILKNGSEALDPSSQIVHYDDLIEVINALNNAGAEAISVNGQRIVQTTAITCEGNVIKINGQRVSSPFTIKAIGSQGLLYGSLTMIGGYLYILDEAGVIVETTQSDNLTVEKYTGVISYKYMKNEK